jgi:hypothetical protein
MARVATKIGPPDQAPTAVHRATAHETPLRALDRKPAGWGARTGPGTRPHDGTWTFTITPLGGHTCDHASETPGYRPSAGLRHLVEIGQPTCSHPGCRRPAASCDLDHTEAYHRGGRTCLCNLAPLCRKHHRCKQAQGWRLEQPEPGVLVWQTPSGRTYTVTPAEYPV